MAYKDDDKDILFVRVPMSKEEIKTIDHAVVESGQKKYEWIRRSLLSAAAETSPKTPEAGI